MCSKCYESDFPCWICGETVYINKSTECCVECIDNSIFRIDYEGSKIYVCIRCLQFETLTQIELWLKHCWDIAKKYEPTCKLGQFDDTDMFWALQKLVPLIYQTSIRHKGFLTDLYFYHCLGTTE